MTRQEMFDKVATHLFKQGVQSRMIYVMARKVEKNGNAAADCAYRGPYRRSCAVGCLIPDDRYQLAMEGGSADSVIKEFKLADLIPDAETAQALQRAHDDSSSWHTTAIMRSRLRAVAKDHYLDDAILDTLSFKDR